MYHFKAVACIDCFCIQHNMLCCMQKSLLVNSLVIRLHKFQVMKEPKLLLDHRQFAINTWTMVGSSVHTNNHHYAIDAAKLVEKCRSLLHSILSLMKANSSERAFQRRSVQMFTLADGKNCMHNKTWTLSVDFFSFWWMSAIIIIANCTNMSTFRSTQMCRQTHTHPSTRLIRSRDGIPIEYQWEWCPKEGTTAPILWWAYWISDINGYNKDTPKCRASVKGVSTWHFYVCVCCYWSQSKSFHFNSSRCRQ